MLLNSVIIILREVLEAALLMSVFLASSSFLETRKRWALPALVAGATGAASYGYFLEPISDLFGGVGQEVCNAMLQYAAFICIAIVVFQIPQRASNTRNSSPHIAVWMALAVAIGVTREGAEILVYVSGFWPMKQLLSSVVVGSIIGICIGFSVGVLIYYLLLAQPRRWALPTSVILLHLTAAGVASQATRLLIQADWIASTAPVWDTSAILSEYSLTGQLLYALVGYESSPSRIELLTYVGSLAVVAIAFLMGRARRRPAPADL